MRAVSEDSYIGITSCHVDFRICEHFVTLTLIFRSQKTPDGSTIHEHVYMLSAPQSTNCYKIVTSGASDANIYMKRCSLRDKTFSYRKSWPARIFSIQWRRYEWACWALAHPVLCLAHLVLSLANAVFWPTQFFGPPSFVCLTHSFFCVSPTQFFHVRPIYCTDSLSCTQLCRVLLFFICC